MQSMSASSKPSMNDCSDLTNIRFRKFLISACCSTVILLSGTCKSSVIEIDSIG